MSSWPKQRAGSVTLDAPRQPPRQLERLSDCVVGELVVVLVITVLLSVDKCKFNQSSFDMEYLADAS